jgi:hypothetical protein
VAKAGWWFTVVMTNTQSAFVVVQQLRDLGDKLLAAGYTRVRPGRFVNGGVIVGTAYTNGEATIELENEYGVTRYRGLQPLAWATKWAEIV